MIKRKKQQVYHYSDVARKNNPHCFCHGYSVWLNNPQNPAIEAFNPAGFRQNHNPTYLDEIAYLDSMHVYGALRLPVPSGLIVWYDSV